jgi:hypothetical protein
MYPMSSNTTADRPCPESDPESLDKKTNMKDDFT